MIVDLLNAEPDSGIDRTAAGSKFVKGDQRIIVTCDEIEEIVFGNRHDPMKTFGRRKNRASRAIGRKDEEWTSVDMQDSTGSETELIEGSAPSQPRPLIRPAQTHTDVNGSVGGEKGLAERHHETPDELLKRLEGQRRAEEREMVRRAARRLIVFGHPIKDPLHESQQVESNSKLSTRSRSKREEPAKTEANHRKCEALMNGAVVEPSFAKGNWSIRWRERT